MPGMNPSARVWVTNCWTRFMTPSAGWRPTLNAGHFITEIFADCSPAGFLTNFSIAPKATALLSFASCTPNANTSGNSSHRRRDVRATVDPYKIWKERLAGIK